MRNLNSIPLSALRAVEAIARTGTLARAAEELGITPGALSQRLTKAEAALGEVLFLREPTGLKPTDLCAHVSPRLTRAMEDLSSAVSEIRAQQDGTLTVSVAPIFASRWLIWRIKKFNQENADISLRVLPAVQVVDLNHSEVDVGIRVSEEPSLGVGAIKLLEQRVFPVCSPALAKTITNMEELLALPVIRENENLYGWKHWLAGQGIDMRPLPDGPTYADASLCLDAAMTGQGIFMAWETLACDAMERGLLASPFGHRSPTDAIYWFATSQHAARKASVKKFQTWLIKELNSSVDQWNKQDKPTDAEHQQK